MTFSSDERRTMSLFKAALDLIPLAPDGYQAPNDFFETNLQTLGRLMLKAATILAHRGELDAEERSWNILAGTTSQWIAETDSGNRDPAIAKEWFRARAELVEPK